MSNIIDDETLQKVGNAKRDETSVDILAKEYPIIYQGYKKVMDEQFELFSKKMLSYGLGNISIGTSLKTEEEIKLSLTSIWIRQMDKMNRLKQMVLLNKENPLNDEPIEDAWKDLCNYSIIALLVKEGKWK